MKEKLFLGFLLGVSMVGMAAAPLAVQGQDRMLGGYAQISSPGRFGVAGSVTGEVGLWRSLRVFGRWVDWRAVEFAVEDAWGFDPWTLELGLSSTLGSSEKVAPFFGGSLGIARSSSETDSSASAVVGLDISIAGPFVFRASVIHQVVFSPRREKHTGFLAGIGLARW